MPEPRAQRTLVKSPPELWAEISDVSTLARHLGEFGDIRITRLEAETTVVWEGDRARGTVNLEASGWGTKVTITAQALVPEPVAATTEEPEAEGTPAAEAPGPVEEEPVAEPVAVAEAEPTAAAETAAEPVAAAPPAAPAPRRRGLLARLFGRRTEPVVVAEPEPVAAEPVAVAEPEPEPVAAAAPVANVVEPEIVPTVAAPTPVAEPIEEPELEGEILATETGLEPFDDERMEAVLVGVLDDLGAAHHRPFSRG
jgi:hypothetical protein